MSDALLQPRLTLDGDAREDGDGLAMAIPLDPDPTEAFVDSSAGKTRGERLEPGRRHTTNRIGVDLTREAGVVRDVPFLVVRTGAGSWLVEEIAIEKLTGS